MAKQTLKQKRDRRRRCATFCQTHTRDEAAEKFGFSRGYVDAICKEFGVKPSLPTNPRTNVDTFTVLKALVDGGATSEVAHRFGIKRQSVQHVRVRARKAGFDV